MVDEDEVPLAGVVVAVLMFGLFTVLTMFGVGFITACALKKEAEDVTPCTFVNAALMLAELKPLRAESCEAV